MELNLFQVSSIIMQNEDAPSAPQWGALQTGPRMLANANQHAWTSLWAVPSRNHGQLFGHFMEEYIFIYMFATMSHESMICSLSCKSIAISVNICFLDF
jgi:hypothetical protein